MDKISIITVSYNSARTIERTIDSVITQNYPQLEYIIIDGGSTDGTQRIIEKYQMYITKYISEPDNGIYDAMNKGIRYATGDIVAFLNSDDYYVDGALEHVAEQFKSNTETDLICGRVYHDNGIMEYINNSPLRYKAENLLCGVMIYDQPAMFVKRKIFNENTLFSTDYKIAGDYDWALRLYKAGIKIVLDEFVYTHFTCEGVSSKQIEKTAKEAYEIANKYIDKNKDVFTYSQIEYYKNRINHNIKIKLMKTMLDDNGELCIEKGRRLIDTLAITREITIFGAGEVGECALILLKKCGIQIDTVWDNGKQKWGANFKNAIIRNPEQIDKERQIVIVASQLYDEEIGIQLRTIGLKPDEDFFDCTKIYDIIHEGII